ncbi:NADH:ubiquinone oxidoreductase, membrane subunit L [Syntrophobacter sp. SbD1]|nr:NADH:ubiquinone oxidoreductase, membrane subunit L [Syntrophobacter sp. SbD1]
MMFDLVWLIPTFPLAGVLLNGLLGRRIEDKNKSLVHWIACGAVGLSFLVTLALFVKLLGLPSDKRLYDFTWFTWIAAGDFKVSVGYQIDPLSMFMCMFVTGVGFLIHVYSIGYMWHDEGRYYRYFTYLNLFMFSMITLILADNFLLMFLGWEGVGVCSYLLISFWFTDVANAIAGKKAFITNRVGDFFFAVGMLLLLTQLGGHGVWSLKFADVFANAYMLSPKLITVICLLFFLGCTAKSAQIPLYIWLPDAMAGPTPVSALIHAATMVTAGVYFVARCNVLYSMSTFAMGVVAVVGALTALLAATIALTQNDIKKVLAYSTVSQLGYMFLGLGVGAFAAGLFHVLTHSFFKALLFMCSGCVIHAMSGEQDMRKMGGLRHKMPITFYTMVIGTLAIVGFPGLSGFFSKDEILWKAFSGEQGSSILWLMGVLAAAMTAFYMFRLIFMTFFNECRASEEVQKHIHEAPKTMTVPLIVLSVLSIIGGYIGVPESLGGSNLVEHFLDPVIGLGHDKLFQSAGGPPLMHNISEVAVHHHAVEAEYWLMLIAVGIVFGGILLAYLMYMKKRSLPETLASGNPSFYRLLLNKWYVDEIYEKMVINPLRSISVFLWKGIDVVVIDGLVNSTAKFFMNCGVISKASQSGYVQRYAVSFLVGVFVLVAYYIYIR